MNKLTATIENFEHDGKIATNRKESRFYWEYALIDLDTFKQWGDFCPCTQITDLDSACGFRGAILIQRGSIYISGDTDKRKSALSCLGIESDESIDDITLIDAFIAYHGIESDLTVIIQTDLNESMESRDGWKADSDWTRAYHESGMTLREFIEAEFLP